MQKCSIFYLRKWLGHEIKKKNLDMKTKSGSEALHIANVRRIFPDYDVEELNQIIERYNSGEINLYHLVGNVWDKAYTLGCVDGAKSI